MKFAPLAMARYFKGNTSAGMATMMPKDERPTPIRMPPPINSLMPLALADTQEPAKAIVSWMEATYFRSMTSDSRPTIGHRTACISSGP